MLLDLGRILRGGDEDPHPSLVSACSSCSCTIRLKTSTISISGRQDAFR